MTLIRDGTSQLQSHVKQLFELGAITPEEKQRLQDEIRALESDLEHHYNNIGEEPTSPTATETKGTIRFDTLTKVEDPEYVDLVTQTLEQSDHITTSTLENGDLLIEQPTTAPTP